MALLEAKGLSVFYGTHCASEGKILDGSERTRPLGRIEDVSFSLQAGCIYDLTGPSGSGKSLLLRACALMIARECGELFLNGRASTRFAPQEWRRQVCLVPQKATLVPGTVRDNLLLPWSLKVNQGATPPKDEELQAYLDAVELDVGLQRNSAQLSGGQAARVALLRAFVTKPEVLLLDEVDAALDDEAALAVGRLTADAAAAGAACLRVRHRASDGFADGTFQLDRGRLSVGSGLLEGTRS